MVPNDNSTPDKPRENFGNWTMTQKFHPATTANRDSNISEKTLNCLVYVPNIYNGGGTTQTLVWITEQFKNVGIVPVICFERTWQFPSNVSSMNLFPSFLQRLPGSWTRLIPKRVMERAFLKRLSRYTISDTFVYIWPQPRLALVGAIKARGFCVFREMINCPAQVCADEVRKARRHSGFADREHLTDRVIAEELKHLRLSDFVTAPNAEVERALVEIGTPDRKILPTSFGWARDRFPGVSQTAAPPAAGDGVRDRPMKVLFVGHIGPRKGAHYLLEAWNDMPSAIQLQLVGTVDPEMKPLLDHALRDERIEHIPYTAELEQIYRSADVFAFPTVEEGGPQVTFEAAGCGLPVITTLMGSARLIVSGRNGLIIPPHDVAALRSAILDLFERPEKREGLARQAELDAAAFTYEKVGVARAMLFRHKFYEYSKASPVQSGVQCQ